MMQQVLDRVTPLYGTENDFQQLKEINENPRLAEAHYCLDENKHKFLGRIRVNIAKK